MTTQTRHFVLTPDGRIREFSTDQAARVASGARKLPEFADRSLRYLQITVTAEPDEDIRVVTTGASIHFDTEGRMTGAGPLKAAGEPISSFEHDACVQLVLRDLPAAAATYH
jgi:hypothetical protein